jgi:very-short-patch-repair endonuclease
LIWLNRQFTFFPVDSNPNAPRLRRNQTDEEKQLWRALRAGRFAGVKFRRQHPLESYILDFYCPMARLSIELDGFQHGLPSQSHRDKVREGILSGLDIEELRFWNHQWRKNPDGVLLEIWSALHRRTGCVEIERKVVNRRFLPPQPGQLKDHSV